MKNLAIIFLVGIVIIAGISYMYLDYRISNNRIQKENRQFECYEGQEINGAEVTTIINKAVDNNENNEVQKDNKGKYIDNNDNSINIDIKMTDNDETYSMETIYKNGMEKFVQYYSGIKFKCTKIEYHKNTGRVKYLLFEQITE